MAEEGLLASGDEVKDMAALLKVKTGEEYTQDMIDEAGKGADDELAKKLEDAYAEEEMGDVVNELYELQKENTAVAEMYSGSLDVGLLTEDQINNMEGLSDTAKKALKNQVKTIEQGRKDINLELQKIYNNSDLDAIAFAGGYD
jgi:hypothetical protein